MLDLAAPTPPAEHDGGVQPREFNWYSIPRTEIEQNSPSRRDGISLEDENRYRKAYSEFIRDTGKKFDIGETTIGAAIVLCHRFFHHRSHVEYDKDLMAFVCLYIASKNCEDGIDLLYRFGQEDWRETLDIVFKNHQITLHEERIQRIFNEEFRVLEAISPDFNVEVPYKYLDVNGDDDVVKNLPMEVVRGARNMINDVLLTSLCLQYTPKKLADAALHFVSRRDQGGLQPAFLVTQNELSDISNQIQDMYEIRTSKYEVEPEHVPDHVVELEQIVPGLVADPNPVVELEHVSKLEQIEPDFTAEPGPVVELTHAPNLVAEVEQFVPNPIAELQHSPDLVAKLEQLVSHLLAEPDPIVELQHAPDLAVKVEQLMTELAAELQHAPNLVAEPNPIPELEPMSNPIPKPKVVPDLVPKPEVVPDPVAKPEYETNLVVEPNPTPKLGVVHDPIAELEHVPKAKFEPMFDSILEPKAVSNPIAKLELVPNPVHEPKPMLEHVTEYVPVYIPKQPRNKRKSHNLDLVSDEHVSNPIAKFEHMSDSIPELEAVFDPVAKLKPVPNLVAELKRMHNPIPESKLTPKHVTKHLSDSIPKRPCTKHKPHESRKPDLVGDEHVSDPKT